MFTFVMLSLSAILRREISKATDYMRVIFDFRVEHIVARKVSG